jgi:hypothetical protein
MKAKDDPLNRLFQAAASVTQPSADSPPFAMEARVLAAWRERSFDGEWAGLLRYLRMGLGFASVLMVGIVVLSLHDLATGPGDEFAIPTVALNLALSK